MHPNKKAVRTEPVSVQLACRAYSALNRLLPSRFVARYGDESAAMFADLVNAAHVDGGVLAVVRVWMAAVADLLSRSPAEHAAKSAIAPFPVAEHSMDSLLSDLRFAVRSVARRPALSMMVIGALALAIGASTAVFSVVDAVLVRPLPFPDADRLVMVFNSYPGQDVDRGSQNPRDFMNYREMTDAFEAIEAVGALNPKVLSGLGEVRRIGTMSVTRDLLPLLGVELALGRHFSADDDWTSALISHAFWQEQFAGDANVVGRAISLNGEPQTIVGVLPADFRLHLPSHLQYPVSVPVWNPIAGRYFGNSGNWDVTAHWLDTVARLAPGISLEQAQAQLDAIAEHQRQDQPRRGEQGAQIIAVPLQQEVVHETRGTLTALLGAVGFLLLIACANVSSLMLVRGHARQVELSVRAACGASRSRIVRMMFTEAAIFAAAGALVGAAIAWAGLRIILALSPAELPLRDLIGMDLRVLSFTIVVSAATTLVFGLLPALTSTRGRLAGRLVERERSSSGFSRIGMGGVLVVAGVALALILLIGGGLLTRSFLALAAENPGLETHNVLTFVAPPPRDAATAAQVERSQPKPALTQYYRQFQESIETLPGVAAVATIWPTPLSGVASTSTYTREETPGEQEQNVGNSQLTHPGYFETMGIPVLAGRTFRWDDHGRVAVVSESFAKKVWPGEDPLGRVITVGWWSGVQPAEVIGVVGDVRSISIAEPDPEAIYRFGAAFAYSPMTYVVRATGDPLALVASIREALTQLDPSLPLDDVRLLSSYVDEQLVGVRFALALIGAFAGVGLLIAVVGLYGVISYAANRRTREIGIRMAVGANRPRIFRMVLGQGLWLAGLGIGAGAFGAVLLTRMIENLLHGVTATDAATFVGLALLLTAVAVLACWTPALRASRADPMGSLRSE